MQELLHENKTFTEPLLKHLDLETSSVCNLSCNFCPRPKENGNMPIEDIKRIIKEFSDMDGETIKPFHRGEPFADKRMPEILKYAKDCGLKVMVNSNATDPHGIYKDCLPFIDWISFSIDEQHGNINNKTYDNVFMASMKISPVEIQSSQKSSFVALAAECMGVHYKVDLPTKRSDKDTTSEVIIGERKYCTQPDWRLVVEYNGDCVGCCIDWQAGNLLGNIYNQSLKEIFYGDKANKLRQELKQGIFTSDICKNCPSRASYK